MRSVEGMRCLLAKTASSPISSPHSKSLIRPPTMSITQAPSMPALLGWMPLFPAASTSHNRPCNFLPNFVSKFKLFSCRRSCFAAFAASSGPFLAEPSSARKAKKKPPSPPDEKLVNLRKRFESEGIDAYIIPSEDAHQSEFMADCFRRRAYISGFTGSAGTAVVTKDHAALWTDGRYFLQAENQLGVHWQLMRAGMPGVPSYVEWLRDQLNQGSKVGIDPFLFSSDAAAELKRCLLEKGHFLVLIHSQNLVDDVWGDLRPSLPLSPLRVHDIRFGGLAVASKLENLREDLVLAGATAIIVTRLDEVAWLFNLRGNDVPHSPVAYAYAIVELEGATLFVEPSKVSNEVFLHLKDAQVSVRPYEELLSYLERLALRGCNLWLDTSHVSAAIVNTFDAACSMYYENLNGHKKTDQSRSKPLTSDSEKYIFEQEKNGPNALHRTSPIAFAKAIKNTAELDGMRQAHLRDAAALVDFWSCLENKVLVEKEKLTEVEVAEMLLEFRAKQIGFLDTSFETICGSGANGAIVHYRAEPETCGIVDETHLLLLDSGGQYVDGTTDITRTVHFGTPTAHQKECYTRVLQGHIAVDKAVFPENTPGFVLDVLARSSLWKTGLDYRHGTGHGVGAALNVHEGPQSISARFGNMTGLHEGMIVSNEPGYYEEGSFGIRIENLLVVRETKTSSNFGGITYLGFEKLTYVPIQTKLLDLALLSQEEIDWVNTYHQEVLEKVLPLVHGNAIEWLKGNTRPISKLTGI